MWANLIPEDGVSNIKGGKQKGFALSEEHKSAISAGLIGHSVSEITKKKIGEKSKGRVHSIDTRKKISMSMTGHRPVRCSCIFCKTEVGFNLFKRYHGERCKLYGL